MSSERIRFMSNNFATVSNATASSELGFFPFSNAIDPFRRKLWKPAGNFTVDNTNNQVYVNGSSGLMVNGNYSPSELITVLETALTTIIAGWTLTYDTGGGTYKFTITNSSSVTINFSTTTNAVWDTIGFKSLVDLTGLSFEADEQRNHTSEFVVFDFGYNPTLTFFAAIGPLGETFGVSASATVTLKANNLNVFDGSEPFSLTIAPTSQGILQYLDLDDTDTGYRYWRFEIVDKLNPGGPEALSIGSIYLGDDVRLTIRNLQSGFNKKLDDPTSASTSDEGTRFYDVRTKKTVFTDMVLGFLEADDRDNLEQLFFDVGISTPFYIGIDPALDVSTETTELTKYVTFTDAPTLPHIKSNIYSMTFNVQESI